jgi:hypothetical protein
VGINEQIKERISREMNLYNYDADAYRRWNGMTTTVGYLQVAPQVAPQVGLLRQSLLQELMNPKEEPEMSVSSKIKELSKDSDSKLLAKYGVTNDCGELTSEGKQVLWDMLFSEYKTAMVEKLKELEAAEKKAAK